LGQLVRGFLGEHGIKPPLRDGRRTVYVIAHFAQAEMGMLSDPLRDLRIRQLGKAHHASPTRPIDVDGEEWIIRFIDLWAYFPMALAKVGKSVGLDKVDVDDRGDLAQLKRNHPDKFERYALRDAEIAVVAFNRFRSLLLDEFGVDPLVMPTLPAVASAIFRYRYLSVPPAPVVRGEESFWRRTETGWRQATRTVPTFRGNPGVRLAALRSYWGGRVEAFGRGLLVGPVVEERDVISLYPNAALAQPLPNAATIWTPVAEILADTTLEGFGRFHFRFPAVCPYPCLPVRPPRQNRLVFPSSGVTDCSFAEIRLALRLGAHVEVIDAFGFEPGDAERNHDLARYLLEFIARKNRATKGTLEYDTSKLLLNALIGKLAEQTDRNLLLDFEREARQHGFSGLGAVVSSSGVLRGAVHLDAGVGGLWAPEWATLILGMARAIVGGIVAASSPYLVSTDAVIVPANTRIACPELALLESLGSGLTVEKRADALFVGRSRQYALLVHPENLHRDTRVLAQDDVWAVVKAARHGSIESDEEFAQTILSSLRAREDAAPTRTRLRLLGAEAAVRESQPINAEVTKEGRTHFRWDGKRRLLDRDANPFTSWTDTAPYTSTARLSSADVAHNSVLTTRRRTLRKRARWKLKKAVHLLRQGKGVRETARSTGIPKSTVFDLRQRLFADEHNELRRAQVEKGR
jgi:hypothetical protein